jgi:hypothetical protein
MPIGERISMAPYRQLSQIGSYVGPKGVLIDCKSDFAQEWAILFLRDVPMAIGRFVGYMAQPHVVPFMKSAKYAPGEPRWVLTDQASSLAVWQNRYFYLVPRQNFIQSEVVGGPTTVEEVKGKPFIWIGNVPTIFSVNSPEQQTVHFYAMKLWLGPSLPGIYTRTMAIKIADFQKTFVSDGTFSVDLPVAKGRNNVELWCEDKPTVAKVPNGDTRTLLAGLFDFRFEPQR